MLSNSFFERHVEAHRLAKHAEAFFRDTAEITLREYLVLKAVSLLEARGNRPIQSKVARMIHQSESAVSKSIAILAEENLVEITRISIGFDYHPDRDYRVDRRINLLSMTEVGNRVLNAAETHIEYLERV